MRKNYFILAAVLLLASFPAVGQDAVVPKSAENKNIRITLPDTQNEYRIVKYKNLDYLKTNPLQLEASGVHPEIYISNTHQGVIIIYTDESNKALKDFSKMLEFNPAYYESHSLQDTVVFSKGSKLDPVLDFTKASSIRQDYKNAFNYKVDPVTGISWSKSIRLQDRLREDMFGKIAYDLIIVISKSQQK